MCMREYQKNKHSTLSGYLSSLITYSIQSKPKLLHNITINFLQEMYIKQNGRCAYSDIPLLLPNDNTDWVMSLERIDTTQGYIKENVCLICREFNSMDRSVISKTNHGSCGWNKIKFNMLLMFI